MTRLSKTYLLIVFLLPLLGAGGTAFWMIHEYQNIEVEFTGGDPSYGYAVLSNRVFIPVALGLAGSLAIIVFSLLKIRKRQREDRNP